MTWNPTQLPEQHGRNIFISGGDAGPGYFAAEQLAATGAHIIVASRQSPVASRQSPVASRNQQKADAARASIQRPVRSARLEWLPLGLGTLASARARVIAGPV